MQILSEKSRNNDNNWRFYVQFDGAGGDGATRPLRRDGSVKELHRDPTVGPGPKVWTGGQKWKK